jgi:2-hydroxychromene-2-carboxylate isomerase
MPEPARFYFNLRSPYSWFALRRVIDEAIPVEALPYVGVPDRMKSQSAPSDADKRRMAYLGEDIQRIAKKAGLAMRFPKPFDTDWPRAHAPLVAFGEGAEVLTFAKALYDRRWLNGEDVAAEETTRAAAQEARLDPDAAAQAMDDPARQARLQTIAEEARELGLFGVPFFVFRGQKFWGQDRIDMLLEAMASSS